MYPHYNPFRIFVVKSNFHIPDNSIVIPRFSRYILRVYRTPRMLPPSHPNPIVSVVNFRNIIGNPRGHLWKSDRNSEPISLRTNCPPGFPTLDQHAD